MTNFDDFEELLIAANTDLNNLKAKSEEIKEQINTIEQDKYIKVHDYFDNLLQIMKRNNICTNTLYIPTSIKCKYYKNQYYILKLTQGFDYITSVTYHDTKIYFPEIGIHLSTILNNYYEGKDANDYGWLRWMSLYDTYREALKGSQGDTGCSSVEDFFLDLVENFDAYEPEISSNFKEAIARDMARKIKEAENEIKNRINVLKEKEK